MKYIWGQMSYLPPYECCMLYVIYNYYEKYFSLIISTGISWPVHSSKEAAP